MVPTIPVGLCETCPSGASLLCYLVQPPVSTCGWPQAEASVSHSWMLLPCSFYAPFTERSPRCFTCSLQPLVFQATRATSCVITKWWRLSKGSCTSHTKWRAAASSTRSPTTSTELWSLASSVSGHRPSSYLPVPLSCTLIIILSSELEFKLHVCLAEPGRGGAIEVRDFKKRAKEGKSYRLSPLGLERRVSETSNLKS